MRDKSYHEDAIEYNETLAKVAEVLALKLDNAEVVEWCTSIGKQHRFHAERHKKSLVKMTREATQRSHKPGPDRRNRKAGSARWQQGVAALEELEAQQKSDPVSPSVPATEDIPDTSSKSIAEQQAEFAAAQQNSEVSA